MRRGTLVLLGLLAVVSLACRRTQPANPPISPPPTPTVRQQMATLAFLAYLGGDLKGSDDKVEEVLAPCMKKALQEQPLAAGWELAWGPAVYKFSVGELDDNMMYAVRHSANPAHLAIVVRGTNPPALLDWLVEDFDVSDQVTWEYGDPPSGAKISKGTSEGLLHLQTMTPAGAPQQTLIDFLREQAKTYPALQIDVTGHSLGGALSPVLALWLADTEREWNQNWSPSQGTRFAVYPLAGPTPGNSEFAVYYDASIGPSTDRMHNPYDIVPLAWNVETLATMADLYEPVAHADAILRGLIDGLRDLAKDKGYTQIEPDAPALPGALNDAEKDYLKQAAWQHHCGYQCALGIDVALTADCSTPSSSLCDQCPQESR
jgi:hypothetical protein